MSVEAISKKGARTPSKLFGPFLEMLRCSIGKKLKALTLTCSLAPLETDIRCETALNIPT